MWWLVVSLVSMQDPVDAAPPPAPAPSLAPSPESAPPAAASSPPAHHDFDDPLTEPTKWSLVVCATMDGVGAAAIVVGIVGFAIVLGAFGGFFALSPVVFSWIGFFSGALGFGGGVLGLFAPGVTLGAGIAGALQSHRPWFTVLSAGAPGMLLLALGLGAACFAFVAPPLILVTLLAVPLSGPLVVGGIAWASSLNLFPVDDRARSEDAPPSARVTSAMAF